MKKHSYSFSSLALMGVLTLPTLISGTSQARDFERPDHAGPRFAANPEGRDRGEGRGPGRGEGGGHHGRGFGGRFFSEERMKLRRVWRGIDRLEEGKNALTRAQAKRVVALVRPWSSRKTMTDADAGRLADQVNAILTTAQKQELDKGGPGGRERDGRGPGGPGGREGGRGFGGRDGKDGRGPGGPGGREGREGRGPGGPGGRDGRGPGGPGGRDGRGPGGPGGMDPAKMESLRKFLGTLNPFYAPTGYAEWKQLPERMQKGLDRRYKAHRATLEALSRKAR